MRDLMDIIFIRNVIIYFKMETQIELIHRLCNYIVPGGYLFLGHSEALTFFDTSMEYMEHTVYRKPMNA